MIVIFLTQISESVLLHLVIAKLSAHHHTSGLKISHQFEKKRCPPDFLVDFLLKYLVLLYKLRTVLEAERNWDSHLVVNRDTHNHSIFQNKVCLLGNNYCLKSQGVASTERILAHERDYYTFFVPRQSLG